MIRGRWATTTFDYPVYLDGSFAVMDFVGYLCFTRDRVVRRRALIGLFVGLRVTKPRRPPLW